MTEWARADRISDAVIALVNLEIDEMRAANRVEPLQIWAGLMLALLALLETAPPDRPRSIVLVEAAIRTCLEDLQRRKGAR